MPHPSEVNNTPVLECDECGVQDEDVERRSLVMPDCSALQHPDQPWRTLCDDCNEEQQSLREKQREKAQNQLEADYRDDPVAIAFYECGRAKFITAEKSNDEPLPPQMQEPPKAPIHCVCDEPLADIELIDTTS